MAKIVRKSQKIFGGDLTASGNVAVFGSLKAGSPSYSIDPATIQSAHYNLGWADAVVANNAPALQDMNALFFVDTYQLAYLMQTGIAEWDAGTTYYIGSWCLDSFGTAYCSIADTNLNNVVTDTTKWRRAVLVSPDDAKNYGVTTSVAASALTINLVNQVGSTPSIASPALFSMRSSTAASGLYNLRSLTSATSLVVPSGATLGTASGVNYYLYLYAIDNAGTIELAISGSQYSSASLVSTTAISGASSSIQTIYSTTARSNVPIKLIARLNVNQTTAGTWAVVPTEQSIGTSFPAISRYQFKGLSADVNNTTGLVSDLTFNGLTIGRTYRVMYNCQFYIASNTGGDITTSINHNSAELVTTTYRQASSIAGFTQYIPGSMEKVFVATATTVSLKILTASATSIAAIIASYGGGGSYSTYGTLEELNDYAVTTDWT